MQEKYCVLCMLEKDRTTKLRSKTVRKTVTCRKGRLIVIDEFNDCERLTSEEYSYQKKRCGKRLKRADQHQ